MNEISSEIETQESFLERLRLLRDDYSNEIPKKEIHGYENPGRYNVLRNWFTLVVSHLQFAVSQREITDPQTIEKVNSFVRHYTSKKFHEQSRTKVRDIRKADRMITLVLRKS